MTPEERALLADLKMFDQADKTRVREHEFKHIDDKRTPEIGPVDENLKLEEPDYEIPWSGKIDENKKVLGNATETAKLAMLDFDDTYLPEEVKRVGNFLGNTVGNLDPAGLAAHAAPKAAIIFPSVAAEKAFMKKYLKDLGEGNRAENIARHMRHTDKARDELTTAYYRNMQDGVYPKVNFNQNSHVSPDHKIVESKWGDADQGRDNILEQKVTTGRPKEVVINDGKALSHEGLHDYDMQAGIQEGNGKMAKFTSMGWPVEREMDAVPINQTNPNFEKIIDQSAFGNIGRTMSTMSPIEQNHNFNKVMYTEFMKYPSFQKMSPEKRNEVMALFSDAQSMSPKYNMLTPNGNRHVAGYGTHKESYPKERAEVGEDASILEGAANINEGFADPEIGRLLREMGISNENFLFPVHLKSDDIDVDALVEQLKKEGYYDEADNLVPRPSAKDFKVKFGGPEYKRMIQEDITHDPMNGPSDLEYAIAKGDIGDRYGMATQTDITKDLRLAKGTLDTQPYEDYLVAAGFPEEMWPYAATEIRKNVNAGFLRTGDQIIRYLQQQLPAYKKAFKLK